MGEPRPEYHISLTDIMWVIFVWVFFGGWIVSSIFGFSYIFGVVLAFVALPALLGAITRLHGRR